MIDQVTQDYVTEPERELTRLRLVTTTPALELGLLGVFAGFARLVREFAGPRAGHPRLVAAAVVAAFRVGLERWIDDAGGIDLPAVIAEHLEVLARGLRPCSP